MIMVLFPTSCFLPFDASFFLNIKKRENIIANGFVFPGNASA